MCVDGFLQYLLVGKARQPRSQCLGTVSEHFVREILQLDRRRLAVAAVANKLTPRSLVNDVVDKSPLG
jgi:hypothetical protein